MILAWARGLVATFQVVCEIVPGLKGPVTLAAATPTEIEIRVSPR